MAHSESFAVPIAQQSVGHSQANHQSQTSAKQKISPDHQARRLDDFFAKIKRATPRVLALDYDGTLAPFCVCRAAAKPYSGVRERLSEILQHGHTRIIVITGRTISDFLAVSGFPDSLEIWGSHGWEHQQAGGTYIIANENLRGRAGLLKAERWLTAQGLSQRAELKPGSLAFHWRGLPEQEISILKELLQRQWRALAHESGLCIKEFDGGLSLCLLGRDKGLAIRTVLERLPDGALAAYLGDDLTDEDAFCALNNRHLGVLVRPAFRPTHAQAWVRPPEELLDFLARWDKEAQTA